MTKPRGCPGYNFHGERALKAEAGLAAARREKARRVPCPICDMLVLPEGMAKHNAIHHTE